MPRISIELDENDIRRACMEWAVTRVLNEGRAIECDLTVTVCNGKPTGTINKVTVEVETDRMKKAPPHYVVMEEATNG